MINKITALLAVVLSVVCLASCQLSELVGKNETDINTTATTTEADTADDTSAVPTITIPTAEYMNFHTDCDPSEYLTLGNYKGLGTSVEKEKVTDEMVDGRLEELRSSARYNMKITDRVSVAGDRLNIDFKGFMDGVQFDGGTAADQTIELSANSGFIDGFADGLVGVMPGNTVTLNLTFPENYYEDLRGKAVVFDVTVNYIYGEEIIPPLTDELVDTQTNGKCKTVDEYRVKVRAELEEEKNDNAISDATRDLWAQIIENCEIKQFPSQQIDYYMGYIMHQYESYAAQYSIDLGTFMAIQGMTEDDVRKDAEEYTREDLVFYSIVRAENIVITDDEYTVGIAKYASSAGTTAERLEAYYGHDYLADNLLWDKTMKTIYDMSNVEIK